jgi:hypothetical protein
MFDIERYCIRAAITSTVLVPINQGPGYPRDACFQLRSGVLSLMSFNWGRWCCLKKDVEFLAMRPEDGFRCNSVRGTCVGTCVISRYPTAKPAQFFTFSSFWLCVLQTHRKQFAHRVRTPGVLSQFCPRAFPCTEQNLEMPNDNFLYL